jgi:hypothetical protein
MVMGSSVWHTLKTERFTQLAEKKESEKEKLFCKFYAETRNVREAAARAGYVLFAEYQGRKLLEKPNIKKEVEKLCAESAKSKADGEAALRRLALGSVSDAVKLLFAGNDFNPEKLDSLELFNISEIKRPKGGGMEIKFFDRVKAAEKLIAISGAEKAEKTPFFEALEQSAALLKNAEGNT